MATAQRRRSTAKKLVASMALVGGALALTFGGAFATFTDTVTAGPQTISSGTIQIGVGPTNDSATGAANIVPGDWVSREIDINSTGATANAASITLGFTANTSSLLDTDATNGLHVTVQSCATVPTRTAGPPPTYTCSGGFANVAIGGVTTGVAVATLEATPEALTPLNSLTAAKQDYLVFTLTLPSGAPGDVSQHAGTCSGTAGGSATTENLEGCTSKLTYTFLATQRAAQAE
jgi:predicted ribosomally synthesized peptide with SipW-like signal peptide